MAVCLDVVGDRPSAVELLSGNVSHAFLISGARGSVILKRRGHRFARIPSLPTHPEVVAVEASAHESMRHVIPDGIPRVLAVDAPRGLLLLEDAGTESLADLMTRGHCTQDHLRALGDLMGVLHRNGAEVHPGWGEDHDREVRRNLLDYCLRVHGVAVLSQAADACAAEEPTMVHGDLSPKNVLWNQGGPVVCDLEGVHRGSAAFEAGYVTAHTILHGLASGSESAWTSSLLRSYAAATGRTVDQRLVGTCAAGVLLYRLTSQITPYDLPGRLPAQDRLALRVRRLVEKDAVTPERLIAALDISFGGW